MLKCFVHEVANLETGFKITYLLDDTSAAAIRAINSGFFLGDVFYVLLPCTSQFYPKTPPLSCNHNYQSKQ